MSRARVEGAGIEIGRRHLLGVRRQVQALDSAAGAQVEGSADRRPGGSAGPGSRRRRRPRARSRAASGPARLVQTGRGIGDDPPVLVRTAVAGVRADVDGRPYGLVGLCGQDAGIDQRPDEAGQGAVQGRSGRRAAAVARGGPAWRAGRPGPRSRVRRRPCCSGPAPDAPARRSAPPPHRRCSRDRTASRRDRGSAPRSARAPFCPAAQAPQRVCTLSTVLREQYRSADGCRGCRSGLSAASESPIQSLDQGLRPSEVSVDPAHHLPAVVPERILADLLVEQHLFEVLARSARPGRTSPARRTRRASAAPASRSPYGPGTPRGGRGPRTAARAGGRPADARSRGSRIRRDSHSAGPGTAPPAGPRSPPYAASPAPPGRPEPGRPVPDARAASPDRHRPGEGAAAGEIHDRTRQARHHEARPGSPCPPGPAGARARGRSDDDGHRPPGSA